MSDFFWKPKAKKFTQSDLDDFSAQAVSEQALKALDHGDYDAYQLLLAKGHAQDTVEDYVRLRFKKSFAPGDDFTEQFISRAKANGDFTKLKQGQDLELVNSWPLEHEKSEHYIGEILEACNNIGAKDFMKLVEASINDQRSAWFEFLVIDTIKCLSEDPEYINHFDWVAFGRDQAAYWVDQDHIRSVVTRSDFMQRVPSFEYAHSTKLSELFTAKQNDPAQKWDNWLVDIKQEICDYQITSFASELESQRFYSDNPSVFLWLPEASQSKIKKQINFASRYKNGEPWFERKALQDAYKVALYAVLESLSAYQLLEDQKFLAGQDYIDPSYDEDIKQEHAKLFQEIVAREIEKYWSRESRECKKLIRETMRV